MGYIKLPTKAWRDPLGPEYLRQLRNDISYLRVMAGQEHIVTAGVNQGEHNAREIPRVVRTIVGTTVTPASSDITAVTNPSTGKYVLTLAAGRFTVDDIRCQINPLNNLPSIGVYKVVSATSIEVYLYKMTSTLNLDFSGQAWVAYNGSFDIAIHSTPLAAGSWNTLSGPFVRGRNGGGLIGGGTSPPVPSWSQLVLEMAEVQRVLLGGHDGAGVHAVREIAKVSGLVQWNGSSYSTTSPTISSVTRTSAGVIEVNHSNAYTIDHAFVAGAGQLDASVQLSIPSTSTQRIVELWKYDLAADTWRNADFSFFIAIHGI